MPTVTSATKEMHLGLQGSDGCVGESHQEGQRRPPCRRGGAPSQVRGRAVGGGMGIPGPGNSLYKDLAPSREHSECGGGRQGPDSQDTVGFLKALPFL